MLLSIDEKKAKELLNSSDKGYVVSTSRVPLVTENNPSAYFTTCGISGIIYDAPRGVTAETRERLMSARSRIERSGASLKTPEELTEEIGKMRSRQ